MTALRASSFPIRPGNIEINHTLIESVDDLRAGKITHVTANLVQAYTSAVEQYRASGDDAHLRNARQAEKSLHILLARLRQKQAARMEEAAD
jgi:hypothetical protein